MKTFRAFLDDNVIVESLARNELDFIVRLCDKGIKDIDGGFSSLIAREVSILSVENIS